MPIPRMRRFGQRIVVGRRNESTLAVLREDLEGFWLWQTRAMMLCAIPPSPCADWARMPPHGLISLDNPARHCVLEYNLQIVAVEIAGRHDPDQDALFKGETH